MEFKIKKLDKNYNAFNVFKIFKEYNQAAFLDSSKEDSSLSRYSFIAVNPIKKIIKNNSGIFVDGNKKENYDFFYELEYIMNDIKMDYVSNLPFIAGAVGYISYDMALEKGMEYYDDSSIIRNSKNNSDEFEIKVPEAVFNIYENIIIFDLINKNTYISALSVNNNADDSIKRIEMEIEKNYKNSDLFEMQKRNTQFKSDFKENEYIKALTKLIEYIKDGHVYVANMTRRIACSFNEDSFNLYEGLRNINKAPFSAYLNYGDFQIISSSPERFISINDRKVITRPIKGTRPRSSNRDQDLKNRQELENSDKDKSELLMIVDLERNDLSKVCKNNTVKVTENFKIETYDTVFHLVSTVEGILEDTVSPQKCIKEMFPGGSITGAPKLRAMEIIDEIEKSRRGIYTGILGYFDIRGNADFNIIIRTILKQGDKAVFGVGGGITYESCKEDEWTETLDKAKALKESLE